MKQSQPIDEKWLKAAVLGTSWAASEIVFGSFLHNLRIPFSGNILTSIGLIILISASYKWKEKGLFWRAGLITALLKSVSPSAIIFGPMIAIFSEALLFEFSILILGRTFAGFLLGSVLAMSWVLLQRILNMVIFYGSNLVELYTSLMKMAEKHFRLETDLVWLPIILLLAVHVVMGLVSAFIGIAAGRSLLKNTLSASASQTTKSTEPMKKQTNYFAFSTYWLILNILLLISSLLLHVYAPLWVWILANPVVILIWASRYKSALRHLSKPNFWIFFVVITMLTAFVFASLQNEPDSLKQGFLIGLQMNFRAALVIVGFSVIGKELYNPRVIGYFRRSSYRQLHLALELSFASVPQVIASLPGVKEFFRNPLSSVSKLFLNADEQIARFRQDFEIRSKVVIVSSPIGMGKTRFCQTLANKLTARNLKVGGFLSIKVLDGDQTIGYHLVDLQSENIFPFLKLRDNEIDSGIGKFAFAKDGLVRGNAILLRDKNTCDVIVIDEVGKLELKGGGWHDSLMELLDGFQGLIILSVRDSFVDEVIGYFELESPEIVDIQTTLPEKLADNISSIPKPD